ncbi:MAG: 3-phosphoshikimate 1-carboxyvinyltransferase [Chloroflexota bacterium]|nr:3-phosphoshikimate 1-carboxyvinyltransferase [Chloroflexota bacterium]
MDNLILQPIKNVSGQIRLPGSKSLSNRLLILSAIARGETEVYNLLDSDDTRYMLAALGSLGIQYQLSDDKTICRIKGLAGPLSSENCELYLGNAGTAVRPLCAVLCGGNGVYTLKADPRMYERPIKDLVDALRPLGPKITYMAEEGFLPLQIHASGLRGGTVQIKGNISSQYLTALLLSAPFATEGLTIQVIGDLVSKPYIDMTLDVMRKFSVDVANDHYQTFTIKPNQYYESPQRILVEGDASSASYFMAAAAVIGGPVRVLGVGSDSIQGDVQVADVLQKMGAEVTKGPDWIEVKKHELNGVDLDLNHIPDAAMTIATTALFAKGTTRIRNIGNWRVKETDRLAAMSTELRKLGATVNEGSDYLEITPPPEIISASIDTYNDHRMAMSFSLAALGDSAITINDPGCVSKTFPNYFETFASICK